MVLQLGPTLLPLLAAALARRGLALRTSPSPARPDVDVSAAESCLQLTTPSLKLRYPEDAEAHMEEIREAMMPFQPANLYGSRAADRFHLEHLWMRMHQRWKERKQMGERLSDTFGPYVPIFSHFVEPWFVAKPNGRRFAYPPGFIDTLRRVLRSDVPYITASANDEGIVGRPSVEHFNMTEFPNLLVLSAGGYGHVPVPLWKIFPSPGELMTSFSGRTPPGPRPLPRQYFVNYVGSMIHAPADMRMAMRETIQGWADAHGMRVSDEADPVTLAEARLNQRKGRNREITRNTSDLSRQRELERTFLFYNNKSAEAREVWHEAMMTSRFSLTPRGFGRTSYHLAEILTFGLIPIHVYTDIPWIPYRRVYDTFGFHAKVGGLPKLLDRLALMSDEELLARERASKSFAESHYREVSVWEQILLFMSGRDLDGKPAGSGDLQCEKLPSVVRDAGPGEPQVE